MEVINSNFEQRLLNLHDITHWSFINFYCEFRKAPSKKLPNHVFSMLSFFTEYSFAPLFSNRSRILRVVFHSSLPRNQVAFEAWNFQGRQRNLQSPGIIGSLLDYCILLLFLELLARELLAKNHWMIGFFQVFCLFYWLDNLTALPSMGTSRPGPILVPFFCSRPWWPFTRSVFGCWRNWFGGFFCCWCQKLSTFKTERFFCLAKGREHIGRPLPFMADFAPKTGVMDPYGRP